MLDVNDNPPYFPQQYYDGNVLETVPVGTAVMSIKAMDNDTEARWIQQNFNFSAC